MIERVEVVIKDNWSEVTTQSIKAEKISSFDSRENRTEHTALVNNKEYHSKEDLVKVISKKLKIDKGIIEIKDEYIIRDDEDTRGEDLYKNGSLYPYEMPDEVDIREDKMSVFEWLRKLKQEKLILNPEFQRYHLIWKDEQKSKFIESVLLNIPLPPIYVNEDKFGRYIIVDGLQRTVTLQAFIEKKDFKLNGLMVLKDLNGKGFDDLSALLKTKIEDKQLFIYIIKPTVPTAMVYDIFNRINTGGTQLSRQEVRNCLYIGKATKLLKDLSEKDYYKKAIDYGISSKRMKDREVVLRYLAFKTFDYKKDYKGDMDEFLGEAMKTINKMKHEEITELERDFERVMKRTFSFFGSKNFRFPKGQSRGRLNIALMEAVGHFFSTKTDQFLEIHKTRIKRNYEKLIKDRELIDSVSLATGDKERVKKRFEKVHEILGEV